LVFGTIKYGLQISRTYPDKSRTCAKLSGTLCPDRHGHHLRKVSVCPGVELPTAPFAFWAALNNACPCKGQYHALIDLQGD
jgi:hypothetical protein